MSPVAAFPSLVLSLRFLSAVEGYGAQRAGDVEPDDVDDDNDDGDDGNDDDNDDDDDGNQHCEVRQALRPLVFPLACQKSCYVSSTELRREKRG